MSYIINFYNLEQNDPVMTASTYNYDPACISILQAIHVFIVAARLEIQSSPSQSGTWKVDAYS